MRFVGNGLFKGGGAVAVLQRRRCTLVYCALDMEATSWPDVFDVLDLLIPHKAYNETTPP